MDFNKLLKKDFIILDGAMGTMLQNAALEIGGIPELLNLTDCYVFGLHPSNIVRMHGNLSEDKEAMLEQVRKRREQLANRLDERPVRYGEGAVLL